MEYRILDTERIQEEAAYWRFPGVAVSVFGEDFEETFCTGLRAADSPEPFGPDTMFTIASCSKSFTSMLAAQLVDEGLLDWDAPVSSYLPEFQMWDAAATETKDPLQTARSSESGMCEWPVIATAFGKAERTRADVPSSHPHAREP